MVVSQFRWEIYLVYSSSVMVDNRLAFEDTVVLRTNSLLLRLSLLTLFYNKETM